MKDAGGVAKHESQPEWWEAPWEFLVHSIVGILIFAIIAAAAVAIDFAVRFLSGHKVNAAIIYGLMLAELAIFATDLFLFVVFTFRTARRAFRRL